MESKRAGAGDDDFSAKYGSSFVGVVKASASAEEDFESSLDASLERAGSEVQKTNVFDVGALTASVDQCVIGAAERERRDSSSR